MHRTGCAGNQGAALHGSLCAKTFAISEPVSRFLSDPAYAAALANTDDALVVFGIDVRIGRANSNGVAGNGYTPAVAFVSGGARLCE